MTVTAKQIIAAHISTYIALLLILGSYVFVSVVSMSPIVFVLPVVFVGPVYYLGVRMFGASVITRAVIDGYLSARITRKIVFTMVSFVILGIGNGLIVTVVLQQNVLPFSVWNPYIEGIVIICVLFALFVQSAVLKGVSESIEEQSPQISEVLDSP